MNGSARNALRFTTVRCAAGKDWNTPVLETYARGSRVVRNGPPWRNVLLTYGPLSNRESESFRAFGTGTVANSGISVRHPETAVRTRESPGGVQAIAGDGRNPLNPAGLATRMKKRRALSRSAFYVNRWVAIVRSRLKGSPSRTRTYNTAVNSRLLYQLSYRGSEDLPCLHARWCSRLSAYSQEHR